jgi:poly [ADP-ribose] polymerase 10/14/15
VYGKGCYFSTVADYSHNYAVPNSSGERHMFLAKVLTGKSARGDSSMKAPPVGYDSTTNDSNIFVVYHDAQAYAEYLIVYK